MYINKYKNVMKCFEKFLEENIVAYLKIGQSLELVKESKDNKIVIK